jgi:hypothetical protein
VPDDAAGITSATARDGGVAYCVAAACYALDLPAGTLTRLASPPAGTHDGAAAATQVTVKTANPDLEVCSGSDCKALTGKLFPGAAPLRAVANGSGSLVAVLLGDAQAGKGYVEVWDVAAQKRTAAFPYARGDFKCGDVAMLGNTIYVSASVCAGPAARGALFTTGGRRIAAVGGNDFGTYGDARVQLDATTWAFLEENAHRIAVQDVATGKLKKTIDTGALWRRAGEPADQALGNPGESALVRLADGKLAVIAGSPANGSVAVVDPASGEVAVVRAPLCGADAATAPAGP